MVGNKTYERDVDLGGPSYFVSVDNRWGFSNTGHFLNGDSRRYLLENTSKISVEQSSEEIYMSARASTLSLTYFGLCMYNGSYNVSLHFAEIYFTNDRKFSSLGRRVFDIYIQVTSRKHINII